MEAEPKFTRNRRLSIAPMIDHTDRFFRYLVRLISRHSLLYTEMLTTSSLLMGDAERLMRFDPIEHPIAVQLGGCEPLELARCAKLAEEKGYDEVNLNLGCPSARVQSGRFGACLMAEPALVADCIRAMKESTRLPVTVKTRIGIDLHDSYEYLLRFLIQLADAGCQTFIVHARKAWLSGLSPKENRNIPPLKYEIVTQLKRDLTHLEIILNGGVTTLSQVNSLLSKIDGVMIGRAAYQNPWMLALADTCIFNQPHQAESRLRVLEDYLPYIASQLDEGIALQSITRHMLGLFQGVPGARRWRRYLSENAHQKGAGIEVVRRAAAHVDWN